MSEARKELPVLYCYSAWSIKGNLPNFGVLYLEAEQINNCFLGTHKAPSCLWKRPGASDALENFRKHNLLSLQRLWALYTGILTDLFWTGIYTGPCLVPDA